MRTTYQAEWRNAQTQIEDVFAFATCLKNRHRKMIRIIAFAVAAAILATAPLAAFLSGTVTGLLYAFYRTRQASLLRLTVVFSLFVANHFVFARLIGDLSRRGSSTFEVAVMEFITSDAVLLGMTFGSLAAAVMIVATAPRETWATKPLTKQHGNTDDSTKN